MKLTKEGVAIIEGDTYLSQDIINQGRLDVARDFLEQFRQYIPVGGIVVDVGACLGDYTATFAEMRSASSQSLYIPRSIEAVAAFSSMPASKR